MTLEIKVGPPQLAIHEGDAILLTAPNGGIPWPTSMGLYFRDTRMVSAWTLYANGVPWELLNSGTPAYSLARIYLTNKVLPTEAVTVPARTLNLVITRLIHGGVHEDLDLTNHSPAAVRFARQIRRNTGPSVMPAAASQRSSARTGHSSVSP